MSSSSETIAAISTPPGRGGLGIIRVSGKQSAEIYQKLIGQKPEPRTAKFVAFRSQAGDLIDKGIAIYFSAPASYTGEDVLECHVHGNESLLNILLDEIVCFGARLARPGEFTERAFLNDKLDLVQAEAVADVIDSHSKKAALAAMRSLDGVFSSELVALKQSLFQARALIEAALDFPDEEDVVIDLSPVEKGVHQCLLNLKDLLNRARSGRQLRQTPLVVIAGPPNVGKSCVMNFLSGYESAIVSDVPGTTRDVVREHIQYEGNIYTLIDTAGIRETEDVIEKEGINRANKVINEADLVLFVYDINKKNDVDQQQWQDKAPGSSQYINVWNKVDLYHSDIPSVSGHEVFVSAKTGKGMSSLLKQVNACLSPQENIENVVFARERHIKSLETILFNIELILDAIKQNQGAEILAEQLRLALSGFDEILGKTTTDDILGEIFSRFCIGK